jgi:hypothetical protein
MEKLYLAKIIVKLFLQGIMRQFFILHFFSPNSTKIIASDKIASMIPRFSTALSFF